MNSSIRSENQQQLESRECLKVESECNIIKDLFVPKIKFKISLSRVLSFISVLIVLHSTQQTVVNGQMCGRAAFPKVFGSSGGDNKIWALDYFEYPLGKSGIIAGGYCRDQALHSFTTTSIIPTIMMYGGQNTNGDKLPLQWQKAYNLPDYDIEGIAFNNDGTKAAGITWNTGAYDEGIIVVQVDTGTLEMFRTFPGSRGGYTLDKRNLIMSSTRIHYQIQSASSGSSVYKVFSIPYPFVTSGIWMRQSSYVGVARGLVFGLSENDLFAFGDHSDYKYVVKYEATTGTINWIYGHTDSLTHGSGYIEFKNIAGTGGVIIAASGPQNNNKFYSRLILDAVTGVPNAESKVYQLPELSIFPSLVIKSLQIIDKDQARCLVSSESGTPVNGKVLMGHINFITKIAKYKRVLGALSYQKSTLAKFSQNKIGIGAAYLAAVAYAFNDGSLNLFSQSFYASVILSTDGNECCYLAGDQAINEVSAFTIDSTKTISDLASFNLIISTSMVTFTDKTATTNVNNIATSPLINIDANCPERSYLFNPISQTPTTYTITNGLPNTVTPNKATTKQVCTSSSAAPTLIFSSDSFMPAGMTISATTGDITLNSVPVGTYPLTIIDQMDLLMQKTSVNIIINVVTNQAPTFISSITSNIMVSLNSFLNLKLPGTLDAEGDTVSILATESGLPSLPSFISFADSTFTFSPTKFTEVGIHTIQVTLSDMYSSQPPYIFTVEVTNTSPYFTSTPVDQVVHLGLSTSYKLISIKDDETNPVTIIPLSFPSFAKFSVDTFTFTPMLSSELGSHSITVELTDTVLTSPIYSFEITVINDPPQFDSPLLSTYTVPLNAVHKLALPPFSDPENHVITVSSSITGQMDLPSFMVLSQESNQAYFYICPKSFTDIDHYSIDIVLSDSYAASQTYTFVLEVTNSPPVFSVTPKDVTVTLGILTQIQLPEFYDPEGHQVTVSTNEFGQSNLPSFISFNPANNAYTVFSNDPTMIGTYSISVDLSDPQPIKNIYKFQIILVQPQQISPYVLQIADQLLHKAPLESLNIPASANITIFANTAVEYPIPQNDTSIDQELLINLGEAISFTERKKNKLIFTPTSRHTKSNPYQIEIILLVHSNGVLQSKKLQVITVHVINKKEELNLPHNTANKTIIQSERKARAKQIGADLRNAKFRIVKVTQTGKAILKIEGAYIGTEMIKQLKLTDLKFRVKGTEITGEIINRDESAQTITIKLIFNNPITISSTNLDLLEVYAVNEIILTDYEESQTRLRILTTNPQNEKHMLIIPEGTQTTKEVPHQVTQDWQEIADTIESNAAVASYAIVPSMLLINILLSFVMYHIWNLLNDLSAIMMLAFISTTVPGIVQTIQSVFLKFIYLDLLQTDLWMPQLFYSSEEIDNQEPLNIYFDMNNFQTTSNIINLGSTFVFLAIFSIFHVAWITANSLFVKCSKRLDNILQKTGQELYWKGSVRFLMQQFTPLFLASAINLCDIKYDSNGDFISISLSFVLITLLPISLIICIVVINRKRSQQKTYESFGPIKEGIKATGLASYWNVFQLQRQLLTIVIIVALRDYPIFQIACLYSLSIIFQCLILSLRPYTEPHENEFSLFTEIMVSIYLYFLMGLSDANVYDAFRQQLGLGMLGCVFVTVAVNLGKALYLIVHGICKRRRLKALKQQKEKQVETNVSHNVSFYDSKKQKTVKIKPDFNEEEYSHSKLFQKGINQDLSQEYAFKRSDINTVSLQSFQFNQNSLRY